MRRLTYLDNLRVLLTALVMLHHTAIAYGASGSWYFQDTAAHDFLTSVLLTVLAAVNQAFFMSLFFFVSAFFTPASHERKGTARYLKDRLLRLGLPLLVYFFVLNPILLYGILRFSGRTEYGLLSFLLREGLDYTGTGPLWFVLALLLFSGAYVLLRFATGSWNRPALPFPLDRTILLFCVGIGLFTFGVRFVFPVGWEWMGLQLGYFPLYVCAYAFGVTAARSDWLGSLSPRLANRWLAVALAAVLLFPVLLWVGGAAEGSVETFTGGWSWQAYAYAAWEPFVCIGISLKLLQVFRDRLGAAASPLRSAGRSAYTAYILHPFFVVGATMLLIGWTAPAFLKFLVAGALAIVTCFLISDGVRRAPMLRRIL